MRSLGVMILVVLVLVATQGCSATTYAPWMSEPGSFDFHNVPMRAQGEIRPMVSGESNGFYFDILWVFGGLLTMFGIESPLAVPLASSSAPGAIKDALDKSNGGHILAAPIVEEQVTHFLILPFYTKRTTVTGIPVELKKK